MLERAFTAEELRRRNRWQLFKYIGWGLLALIVSASLIRAVFAPGTEKKDASAETNQETQIPTPDHDAEGISPVEPPLTKPSSHDEEPTAGWILTLDSEHEAKEHVIITSNTTQDGHWFSLDWGRDYDGFNPNFIPHPVRKDHWYMFGVGLQSTLEQIVPGVMAPIYSVELYCEATFINGKLSCIKSPLQLPIASTTSPHCTGGLEGAYMIIGPGESRMFMGENGIPYIMWVTPSEYGCSGPHLQDLRRLVQWYTMDAINLTNPFFFPTDLQRPPPRNFIEKNWFVFWDQEGAMYLHYDISPQRVFSRLDPSGSGAVGEDLAPYAAEADAKCMAQHMPHVVPKELLAPEEKEHIHQSSTSLALTMCKRSDPNCKPSAENTFIIAIFQHKKFYGHNLYEPYVVLFKNTAPFQLQGIGSKPLWISGRGMPGSDPEAHGQSQMMYIQSINWKEQGVGYQGFLDDVIMVAFGVEDKSGGGIDVVAEQLVREMNWC